ncbi:MAG: sugar transferase [Anaerolineae bacterium]
MSDSEPRSLHAHHPLALTLRYAILVVSLLAAIGGVVLLWYLIRLATVAPPILRYGRGITAAIALGVIQMLFTVVTQRIIARSPLPVSRSWSYRLAFIISAGLAIILWVNHAVILDIGLRWYHLVGVVVGALLGGVLATSLDDSLWEESLPPSPALVEAVRQHHTVWMGDVVEGPLLKRVFDIVLSALTLIVFAPVFLVIIALIWLEDPGPILFVKNSVGRGGENFHQFKFRSMIRNAEAETGPIPARVKDERALVVGVFLRKTALDELPQMLNILRGDMSFVGPRPLRTVQVYGWLQEIPQWAVRHRVRPGLSGLAQVVGSYYYSPLQKLRYDRIYINHISLAFDLKLVALAFLVVFYMRWRPDWDGHIPRKWLKWGAH